MQNNACQIRNEMQGIVRVAAGPWSPGDSVKAALCRASREVGMPYSRVRKLWYGLANVWAYEADALRAWRVEADLKTEQRLRDGLIALQAKRGRIESAVVHTNNRTGDRPAGSKIFTVDRRRGDQGCYPYRAMERRAQAAAG